MACAYTDDSIQITQIHGLEDSSITESQAVNDSINSLNLDFEAESNTKSSQNEVVQTYLPNGISIDSHI